MTEERTVLFIDDEIKVLRSLEMGLLHEPYHKLFANSGKEALELLSQNEVHVIITDMRMPDMSGLDLLRIVKEQYPHIIRMVLSGYMQVSKTLPAIEQGEIFKCINKPWRLEEEIKPAVRQGIDHYNLQSDNKTALQKN